MPAAEGPAQRGAAPTEAALLAGRGSYSTRTIRSANGAGFNNGTIYAPNNTADGPYPAIVVVPGFISNASSVNWYGPMLASWGFVVMVINTNTPLDFPAARANQQINALRWLATQSPVADIAQDDNWGAAGWSMGGGGTLDAERREANIHAGVPLAPWEINSYIGMQKPTLVVTCQGDTVAPPAAMGNAFYAGIAAEKAHLAVPGSHFCVTNFNAQIAKFAAAWFKRWLDGDTRFDSFVCSRATGAVRYENTCPMQG